jgi:hypothetical protein
MGWTVPIEQAGQLVAPVLLLAEPTPQGEHDA